MSKGSEACMLAASGHCNAAGIWLGLCPYQRGLMQVAGTGDLPSYSHQGHIIA